MSDSNRQMPGTAPVSAATSTVASDNSQKAKPQAELGRIFIVGCPRSGTTLVQSLLAGHSKILTFTESHLFDKGFFTLGPFSRMRPPKLAENADRFVRENNHLSEAARDGLLASGHTRPLVAAARQIVKSLDEAARAAGATHWVEKTPDHVFRIPLIRKVAPQARFIHVIRKPASVLPSLFIASRQWGRQKSWLSCAVHWTAAIWNTVLYARGPQHFILDYDGVLQNRPAVTKALVEWLGLDWEERVISNFPQAAARVIAPGETWKAANLQAAPPPVNAMLAPKFTRAITGWAPIATCAGEPAMLDTHGAVLNSAGPLRPGMVARFFVIGILGAEVFGWLFFTSDLIRALMVASVLLPCLLLVLIGSGLRIPRILIRTNLGILAATAVYVGLGVYGALLGILNRNGSYYIVSDLYHWFGEGMLVAALTVAMLNGMSSRYMMGLISLAGLLLGTISLLAAIGGTFGLPLAGGHIIPNLHIWRLEAGRGFPAAPLAFITAIVAKGNTDGWVKITSRLALVVMLMVLFVTFKRSQWLTYAFLVIGFLMPPRWQWTVRWVVGIMVTFAFAAMLAVPGGLKEGANEFLGLITYNPNYAAEDSIEGRATQMLTVVPWVMKRPLQGYGFGAKIYVYTPHFKQPAETHYIHNAFFYYAVQLGLTGLLVGLMLYGGLVFALFLRFGLDPEWDWLVYGSFTSLCALAIMSMALVCVHTPLFGFSLGGAALAILHVPLRRRTTEMAHSH